MDAAHNPSFDVGFDLFASSTCIRDGIFGLSLDPSGLGSRFGFWFLVLGAFSRQWHMSVAAPHE